jgi:hypothetical protein
MAGMREGCTLDRKSNSESGPPSIQSLSVRQQRGGPAIHALLC